jgi:hypothetical protein
MLALAGLAVTAPPALAWGHWHSQMKSGSATASRAGGGCTIAAGSHRGSLAVDCRGNHTAQLTYTFSTSHPVQGRPIGGVDAYGFAHVSRSAKVTGKAIRVTVRISGGWAQVDLVSVGYY